MPEELELEVCTDNEFEEAMMDSVEYPCLFIEGITSNDEIEFFRKRSVGESSSSVRLYCMVGGEPVYLGLISLVVDTLLAIRSIFNYRLFMHKDRLDFRELQLDDPEMLMKFIKI